MITKNYKAPLIGSGTDGDPYRPIIHEIPYIDWQVINQRDLDFDCEVVATDLEHDQILNIDGVEEI